MADAKKCDRCGAFYVPDYNHNYSVAGVPSKGVSSKIFDLCPSCNEALDKFMKLKPVDIVTEVL